jgi:hypothetical protein
MLIDYVALNFYILGEINSKSVVAHLYDKAKIIKNFKIKIFIDMNVIEPEQINLCHNLRILTVGNCQNLTAPIKYHSKINQSFKKSIKIKRRIKLKSNSLMNVPIQMKNSQSLLINRFLIFEPFYNGSAKRLI